MDAHAGGWFSVLCGTWNVSHTWGCSKEEIGGSRLMGNQSLIRQELEKFVKWFVPFITGKEKQLNDFK